MPELGSKAWIGWKERSEAWTAQWSMAKWMRLLRGKVVVVFAVAATLHCDVTFQ